jgi:hypothetical protein
MKNVLAVFVIALMILSVTVPLNTVYAQACPDPALVEDLIKDAERDALTASAAAQAAQMHADAGNAQGAQDAADTAKLNAGAVNATLKFLKNCDISDAQLDRLEAASLRANVAELMATHIADKANNAANTANDTIVITIEIIKIIIEIIILGLVITITITVIRIRIRRP